MGKPFTPKELRILFSCAEDIFKSKSLIAPKSISEIPRDRTLARELRIRKNKHLYLTDFGFEKFMQVVEMVSRRDYFDGKADYSDIWRAWKSAVQDWLSQALMPDNPQEVLDAISNLVTGEIHEHFFIVPIFGIKLESEDSFSLGPMRILRSPISVLKSANVSYEKHPDPSILEARPGALWLHGSAFATERVARRLFSEQTVLVVGLIAIAAAATYENGAAGFRIGTGMTPEDAPGRSVWMSWSQADSHVTTHFGSPRGQPFSLDTELSDRSDAMRMIGLAATNLQKGNKTEVEEAIERAIYWFSDAHRDTPLTMRIVKYWSCVEAFFSLEKERVSQSVSSGLASILTYGGFRFVHFSEYGKLKKQISDMYDLRSLAVHRGAHQHVTEKDVARFSQWVAWMIIEILQLSHSGYATLNHLKREVDRLDAISRT